MDIWPYDYFPFFAYAHGDFVRGPWVVLPLVDVLVVAAVLLPVARGVESTVARLGLDYDGSTVCSPTWRRLSATVALAVVLGTLPSSRVSLLAIVAFVAGGPVASLLPVETSQFGFGAATLVPGILVGLALAYLLVCGTAALVRRVRA